MDWLSFLDENHIHYVTRGPNTKKGEISIKCPICPDDPSEHLGINLTTGFWGCLRDQSHRGKSPRHLIKKLMGCSSHQAHYILKQYSVSDPDGDLGELLESLKGTPTFVEEMKKQANPQPEFDAFHMIKARGCTRRFHDYLAGRLEHLDDILPEYQLKCATTGQYHDRIIIPVWLNGELLGWTARAIGSPVEAPRYLASDEVIKTTVFHFDKIKKGGKRLFVCEGPFDAIVVDAHALVHGYDVRATCTFGTSVVPSQFALLRRLAKEFDQTFVLFDQKADKQGAELASWIGAKQAYLPPWSSDPAELTTESLNRMCEVYFNGDLCGLYRPSWIPEYLRKRP